MQKYKEINGNDYVKNSRTTINETMQSIQSMNSGTAFPTTNLFEGMKCYRTDLKKTYTLTDVENNTWVEDAHATLSDEATHAASATKLQTARSLNLGGAVTADAANFDGTTNATINVKTLDATKLKGTASVSTTGNAATATKVVTTAAAGTSANIAEATMASNDLARIRVSGETNAGELALETSDDGSEPIVARQYTGVYTTPVRTAKILDESGNTSFPGTVVAPKFTGSLNGNAATASKLSTARKINITGNATGAATFDGTSDVSINVSVSQAAHADKATQDTNGRAFTDTNAYMHISALADNTDFNNVKTTGIYYCTGNTYSNRPHNSWGILTVYSIGTVKQEYRPGNEAVYYTREYNNTNWTEWSKVNAANADTAAACSGNSATATKLATARAISLTGNASGSANFDGSGNVSINTTVNESKHAAAADTLKSSAATETSTVARPVWLSWEGDNTKQTVSPNLTYTCSTKTLTAANFKGHLAGNADTATTANAMNSQGDKTAIKDGTREPAGLNLYKVYSNGYPVLYGNLLSIGGGGGGELLAEWSGVDKGIGHLYYRNRRDAGNLWSDWRTVAFTSDINSFAPTKTGGGASGTWPINISGTATKVLGMYTGNGGQQGPSFFGMRNAGFLMSNQPVNGHSEFKNWLYMDPYSVNDVGGATAIGVSRQETRAYIMSSNADRKQWDRTAELLSSANYNSFAPTKTGGGASGTWGINISGNAASATNADKVDGYHASDIINRISAANTGGIVAASLTENGYVKFANGLILQWGNMSNPVTFPIAFPTKAMNVVATLQTNGDGGNMSKNRLYIQTLTTTGFTIQNPQGNYRYYAVGY